jgi:type I restriction enzyme S subunit
LPKPPLEEQHAIAAFLDRETARIDALVAKKKELIALLQEKRTALIAWAVTKGLDPNVPMKDSGIEWLGEIPTHWEVRPLKRVFANLDSRRKPLSSEERATMRKEYPYYGASGIIDQVEGYLFDEPLILVAEDGANLYSRSTPLAFVATGKFWVNNHAHILNPVDGNVDYWAHVLASIVYDPWITGSAQPKLTSENLGSIPLPAPPVCEREQIVRLIHKPVAEIGFLIAKVREAIYRLKELRTALISAAVTGKIDVREEVA